jgi:hypothetical protein
MEAILSPDGLTWQDGREAGRGEAHGTITQLQGDIHHLQCKVKQLLEQVASLSLGIDPAQPPPGGWAYREPKEMAAEIEKLKEEIATCRELRKYDRIEIEHLRHLIDKAKP